LAIAYRFAFDRLGRDFGAGCDFLGCTLDELLLYLYYTIRGENMTKKTEQGELIPTTESLPEVPAQTPANLIQIALEQKADVDQLTKLMELQERFDANEAKKAFVKAMTAFKADPPKIIKDRRVNYGNTNFSHASLANITNVLSKALSDHGLSVAWRTKTEEKIFVECIVTHTLGHSESCSLTAGPDTSGGKNAIQAVGSAVSYLERYTILSLLGLATADMDDDGNAGESVEITPEQIEGIVSALAKYDMQLKPFLDHFHVDRLEDLRSNDLPRAKQIFNAKKRG
jgi:hypothetical protein